MKGELKATPLICLLNSHSGKQSESEKNKWDRSANIDAVSKKHIKCTVYPIIASKVFCTIPFKSFCRGWLTSNYSQQGNVLPHKTLLGQRPLSFM